MDWNEMLAHATSELSNAEGELREVRRKVDQLRKVVDGLNGLSSSTEALMAVEQADLPKPKDAVLTVIREHPGEPLAPKDVTALIREANLFDDELSSGPTAYSTALSRLADDPIYGISKQIDGRYIYLPDMAER